MRRIPIVPIVLLLALATGAAGADERPATQPTRDVDVTYEMAGLDAQGTPRTLTQRSRWAPSLGLIRVDPPGPEMYVIVETQKHHLLAVQPATRTVMLMEADTAAVVPGLSHATQFERVGTDTVAGLPCTEWHTEDSGGQPTTVCLTGDGVLLRAKAGTGPDSRVLVQARSVTYGAADPAVFAVPEGYRTVRPAR